MTINATRAALSGDRELLEMAAKAIGGEYLDGIGLMIGGSVAEWNPMADDGDALRLAVKLSLIINNQHNEVLVEDRRQDRFWQPHDGDEQAATRRAIVRAAASIGRAAPAAAQAQRHEFDDCTASPTGKHSESWFANGDCEYCKAGAQPNAPLFWAQAQSSGISGELAEQSGNSGELDSTQDL